MKKVLLWPSYVPLNYKKKEVFKNKYKVNFHASPTPPPPPQTKQKMEKKKPTTTKKKQERKIERK
jgi:hypothetical protein